MRQRGGNEPSGDETVNTNQYEKRRSELARYIDEALKLPHIYGSEREMLQAIRRKIFESQFKIVLISGFQCGKSTTFNALCDGMEVSPRGAYQKTSATVISAQNTMIAERSGTAEVIWRTDNEIASLFAKYLLQEFATLDATRFGSVAQADEFARKFNFSTDLPLLEKALRRRVEMNKAVQDVSNAEREALRMAWLVLCFYDDPRLADYRRQSEYNAEDIGRMVCFPQKWNEDWMFKAELPFDLEDCLFLFIREARIYIQSERLRRTGSVLIDCPGLFASEYDSRVAFDILENADAVWYIMSAKGLGDEDLKCAQGLFTAKPGKVFFTVNLNGHCALGHLKEHLIPDYVNTLKDLKVNVTPKDFLPYHALLALLSVQAERKMKGSLDTHSIKAVEELEQRSNPGQEALPVEEILAEQTKNCLMTNYGYRYKQLENFNLLAKDNSGIELLNKLDGFETIISHIEKFVIQRKAEAILIEEGAKKVIALLDQVETNLALAEEMAYKDKEQLEEEFELARQNLENFQEFCAKELEAFDNPEIDSLLALDYWKQVIVSSIAEVAYRASEIICMRNRGGRKGVNEQIINDVFSDVVKPKATAWVNCIKQGTNEVFNMQIMDRTREIKSRIEAKWNSLVKAQPLLGGLPSPMPVIGVNIISHEFIDTVVAQTPGVNKEVISGAAAGMAIGMLIGSFVFPAIGTLMGGLLGGIFGAFQGDYHGTQTRRERIEKAILKALNETIASPSPDNSNRESIIKKQEFRMKAMRMGIVNTFTEALNNTSAAFEERLAMSKKRLERQITLGEKLLTDNSQLRSQKIEPLRENIELFVADVRCECDKTE